MDGLAIYSIYLLDQRSKSGKQHLSSDDEIKHETHKKEVNATKLATREQQHKKFKRQIQNHGKAYPNTAPKYHIVQPDKMK
jgi:hypothetical protein